MKYRNHILAILAGLAAAACLVLLYVGWSGLGFRAPVAGWISEMGFPGLAGYWGLLWSSLPGYFLALILGYGIGRYLKLQWWAGSALGLFGYLAVPDIYFLLTTDVAVMAEMMGIWPIMHAFLWKAIAVPLVFFAAWWANTNSRDNKSAHATARG